MNYNHLYYFWFIAKEGSIKNASTLLNVSQPTLSDQLKTFEESIGEKLFDRYGRKLHLNPRGKQVYNYANRMFRIANELQEMLLDKNSSVPQVVNIGFVPTIGKGRVYEILVPFLKNRDLMVKAVEGDFDSIFSQFELDELDVLICEKPVFDLSGKYRFFNIVESTFFVVASPSFRDQISHYPKCLSEIPFLNYTHRSGIQPHIFEYFRNLKVSPTIIGEMDDVNLIRRFTINGHCFSILPRSAIRDAIKDEKLIVLSELKELHISIFAIVKNRDKNQLLIDLLESCF